MKQFQFTAPALLLVLASLENEVLHPLHVKRPPKSREKVVELNNEGSLLRAEASPGI